MNHQRIQKELSAYLDNELPLAMRERVEAHLRSCNECSEMLSAFQKNRQMIADLLHSVPSTLKGAVMAKIHTQFQDELSAYLDNELAPAMRERVETHLHSCDECSETLAVFQQNRERIRGLEHRAPASIQHAVMAQIRQQSAAASVEKSTHLLQLPDIAGWLLDFGRWFMRPVTAGATGILTLALILGALYFYPTTSQYEEVLDYYFGLHTEQLTDNTLSLNGSITQPEESSEPNGDTDLFFDIHLENVGN